MRSTGSLAGGYTISLDQSGGNAGKRYNPLEIPGFHPEGAGADSGLVLRPVCYALTRSTQTAGLGFVRALALAFGCCLYGGVGARSCGATFCWGRRSRLASSVRRAGTSRGLRLRGRESRGIGTSLETSSVAIQ